MASQPRNPQPLYPQILESNPEIHSPIISNPNPNPSAPPLYTSIQSSPPDPNLKPTTTTSSYPSLDMSELVENLFPYNDDDDPKNPNPALPPPIEETLIRIPGAILHLIDKHRSIELASGDLTVARLRQGDSAVAVLVRVDTVQWPLARDAAAVKLDESHYFFSLRVPDGPGGNGSEDFLNYGLTLASKGQEGLMKELDGILESYSGFSIQRVVVKEESEVMDRWVVEVTEAGATKEMVEERSAAYWTTLAPNVEDYSGCVAKAIAMGSGRLVRGVLWCGDVTVDRLKWGNDMLKRRIGPSSKPSEISQDTMKRIERVKRVTKMSEKVATGLLSGVVKVSGYFTSSVINSKAGKKIFGLVPGEIVLASLDGFGKICDAVEVAGKNVLSTSSVVTTGLVSHRYGEQAAEMTNHSLDAAGHALGTAWAVFKIRKALDPKSSVKPGTLAKSAAKAAAAELKSKLGK